MTRKDGGYLLPEVVDPQRIRLCLEIPNDPNHLMAFWGALQDLGKPYNWHNDEAHTALLAAAVWRDVWYKARESFFAGECASEEVCQTYGMSSPRITWFPENPYHPHASPPDGYLVHPFTVVNASTLDSIISVWGLGYQIGDVYTDLLHIPIWSGGENPVNVYSDFPYFRVNDLNGVGTVKLHLLNLPQGGRFLILKDGVFDIFNLQLVETNKDGSSIPAETQVPQIIEIEFEEDGEHFLDVIWLPTLDDVLIPIHFGGGVRKIEICGFGLEGCGDMTECCDQTNVLLSKILKIMEGGFKIVPFETTLPTDFKVDCTPDNFEGNEGDEVPVQIQRYNAMCLAVTRWMIAIMYDWASDMNLATRLDDVLALAALEKPPSFTTQIETVAQFQTVPDFNKILNSDNGFNTAVCLIVAWMRERGNSFSEFKTALTQARVEAASDEDDAVSVATNMAELYGQSRINYTIFSKALERAFEDIQNGDDFTCECVGVGACDVADFQLIAVNDCVVTKIDDTHYHVVQTNFTDAPPDKRKFLASVRDVNWRCFNLIAPGGGWAGYDSYICDGTHVTGVGGGTGQAVQIGMVTLEYDWDPIAGIDVVFEIACPT